ncbi:head decoration protein [Azospirillum brasilense]|nr:head decoration protein [Azospirillum brasilense]
MSLSVSTIGDNASTPGVRAETYVPDQLIAGRFPLVTDTVTLLSGQVLARGSLLGMITVGTATTSGAGNTGNGTITMDASTPVLAGAKVGIYTATCVAAASNGGTFRVEDPDGFVLGDVAVGATFSDDIKFVIADGATDFVVGDKFTITVAAGSGKYKLSAAAATDGSQDPVAILADHADATGGDVAAPIYLTGEFNQRAMTFGTGHTAASVKNKLRTRSIFVKTSVSAADPT